MKARFVLAPQAAIDLAEIWRYIKSQSSVGMADHVESVIRANEEVKFFPVYSYLIVYRSATKPLRIVAIVHGRRDVEQVLRGRL